MCWVSFFYIFLVATMAYRLGVSQFLCSRRFRFWNIALSLLFLRFLCVFCRRFAVSFVATIPLLQFSPVVLVCYSTCAWHCVTFSPSVRLYLGFLVASAWFFWGSCVFFVAFAVASALWFSSLLVFRVVVWCCLVSWSVGCFVCGWCVVGVCLVCVVSLVGVLLLVLFCFGLSAVLWSSWCWLCVVALLSVLLLLLVFWLVVVVVLLCPLFCSWCVLLLLVVSPVRCTVLVLVASGWFMRLVVVLLVVGLLVLLSPLFLVRHDQALLWFSCGFNAECHPGWVAVWYFCSWRLCLWVVVCHPVGSSGSCFVYHVASWSLCCCSCLVSVVSDSSHLLYGVDVSFYCPVFVSVCVYCCVPCFSAWCCSCLLSVAVCSCLLSVHGCCWLWCRASGVSASVVLRCAVACFFLLSVLVLSFFVVLSIWFCVFPLTFG